MFKQVSIVLVAATLTIAAIVLPGCSTVSANDVITPDQLKFTSDSALYQSHAATSGMPWPSNGLSGWRNGREYRSALVREAISRRGASEEDAALVNAGELRVGMDRDLAWWSWGPPHRIERERVQGDQVERWWWHAVDDLPEIRERRATMINGRVLYFTVDQYRGRLLRESLGAAGLDTKRAPYGTRSETVSDASNTKHKPIKRDECRTTAAW